MDSVDPYLFVFAGLPFFYADLALAHMKQFCQIFYEVLVGFAINRWCGNSYLEPTRMNTNQLVTARFGLHSQK